MDPALHTDPQEQLRSLCKSLVKRQQNLDEFKQLLSQYPPIHNDDDGDEEPLVAADVRERLNQRIREWTGQSNWRFVRDPDAHVASDRGGQAHGAAALEGIEQWD